jgi:hypothetical protein
MIDQPAILLCMGMLSSSVCLNDVSATVETLGFASSSHIILAFSELLQQPALEYRVIALYTACDYHLRLSVCQRLRSPMRWECYAML